MDAIMLMTNMDPVLVEGTQPNTTRINPTNLGEILDNEEFWPAPKYIWATSLGISACRSLNKEWSSLANGMSLDLDVIYYGWKGGQVVQVKREGFGWDDYSDQRFVFIYPAEFFAGFEGEDPYSEGWKYILEEWVIGGKIEGAFDVRRLEEVLSQASQKLHEKVVVISSEAPLGDLQYRTFTLPPRFPDPVIVLGSTK